MASNIRRLLNFADKIQQQISSERDSNALANLRRDLKLLKAEIGNRILELPVGETIAPVFKAPTKEVQSKIDILHHGSPVSSPKRKRHRSLLVGDAFDPDSDILSEQFETFLAEKRNGSPQRNRRARRRIG
jgi:hypothetical protein